MTNPVWLARLRPLARIGLALGAVAILSGCATGRYAKNRTGLQAAALQAPQPAPKPEIEKPEWSRHFKNVSKGAILISLDDRRLGYWAPGGKEYREFPIAVPRNNSLEKRGRTRIVRRRRNPDWRPTPDMLRRNPNQPTYIGPGPHNPLGERALYLGWTYYAIHGTNDPSSIGSRATSGCFRMFPEHIEWLYEQARLGTPVRVVDSVPEIASRSLSLKGVDDPTALADVIYRRPNARAPRKVVHKRIPRRQPVAVSRSTALTPAASEARWPAR